LQRPRVEEHPLQSPENERRRLLGVAIDTATDHLRAPIDRVEVKPQYIVCWSGGRKVVMAYSYSPGGQVDADGHITVTPGSGSWDAIVIDAATAARLERKTRAAIWIARGAASFAAAVLGFAVCAGIARVLGWR
jgi:hypothetical protein